MANNLSGKRPSGRLFSPLALPQIRLRDGRECQVSQNDLIRFEAKLDVEGECWVWNASLTTCGYGKFDFRDAKMRAHRFAYLIARGPIPDDLVVDHLCRNRMCSNPAHLEAVTSAENIRRSPIAVSALNSAKTHCLRGHEYTEANTVVTRVGRACRTCRRWRERVAKAKKAGRPYEAEPPKEPVAELRGAQARNCPNGHPYDEANTQVQPSGKRQCRACARLSLERRRLGLQGR